MIFIVTMETVNYSYTLCKSVSLYIKCPLSQLAIASLGSILDSQQSWKSSKFQLAKWSSDLVVVQLKAIWAFNYHIYVKIKNHLRIFCGWKLEILRITSRLTWKILILIKKNACILFNLEGVWKMKPATRVFQILKIWIVEFLHTCHPPFYAQTVGCGLCVRVSAMQICQIFFFVFHSNNIILWYNRR